MSICSDKLTHIQVVINCRYSVTQMCTGEDMLTHYSGSPFIDICRFIDFIIWAEFSLFCYNAHALSSIGQRRRFRFGVREREQLVEYFFGEMMSVLRSLEREGASALLPLPLFVRIVSLEWFSLSPTALAGLSPLPQSWICNVVHYYFLCFSDNAHVALCYDDGLLWMGNLEEEKVGHFIGVKTEIHKTVGTRNPNSLNQIPKVLMFRMQMVTKYRKC